MIGRVAMGVRSPLLKTFGDDFSWSLLNAVPDGVLIASETGEVVFVNDQAAGLLGYEVGDLLGRVVDDLLPESLRPVHRAHRTRYRAAPTPRSMGAGLLLRASRADGSEFPVEVSLKPLRLGGGLFVVAGIRDVTDRVETEDHLHRVLHTLDASDDGVFIFDAVSLRFSYVNDGAVRLVGYDRDDLLRMTPLHLDPNSAESDYRQLVEALQSGPDQAMTRPTSVLRKDGVDVPVETTYQSAPTGRQGARWIVALSRDITARLAAEEELRESREALQQAEQVLAVADDRDRIARDLHDTVIQRLFAAGLTLQGIVGMADDRVRGRLTATIEALDESIRELRMAIFSLQGAGAAPGGLRGRLLDVVIDAGPALGFEPRLQFEGPVETIESHIAEHLVPTLREALSNVAHHASAHGARVEISVTDEVVLTVIDDGTGVPAEVLGGRGLANLANRADKLGGSFEITAEATGGSRLSWRVPVEAHTGKHQDRTLRTPSA
jgi:PAS domain S-box-containing protein